MVSQLTIRQIKIALKVTKNYNNSELQKHKIPKSVAYIVPHLKPHVCTHFAVLWFKSCLRNQCKSI